jgi:RNA polymerase sigma factor (sigma-70 family)
LADDVHEAIQYAVVVAYEASMAREPLLNVQAYVTTVAHRALARTALERRKMMTMETPPEEHEGTSEVHDDRVDAHAILGVLPPRYADVLRRHYLEGLPLEDIAREDGVSGPSVRKRHERAIKLARRLFAGK